MPEFSITDVNTGKIITGVEAYKQVIEAALRLAPGELPQQPEAGFSALEKVDGRVRSRSGLDATDVVESTEQTILRDVPGIVVADIEPEMTATLAVGAINIRFQIVETGELGELRVEIPTA
jgi:hypothetical protein